MSMMKYSGEFPVIETTINRSKKVADMAYKLAYQTNTSKANYPNGKPTVAFKNAKEKVFKNFHFWSKASKAGASCDVFVGTVVRASGVDTKFPAGLWKQLKYMEKSGIMVKTNDPQSGDIFIYKKDKAGRHGHIGIIYNNKVKEASANNFYGKTTDTLKTRLSINGKKYVYVFHFKDEVIYKPLKKGSEGKEVEKLQRYLNWYFADQINKGKMKSLKIDGIFGKLTLARVKLLQQGLKLQQDGVVGKLTLKAMKEAKR